MTLAYLASPLRANSPLLAKMYIGIVNNFD